MATLIRRNQGEVAPSSASVWDPFRVMRDVLRWDPFRELEAGRRGGDYGLFAPSFDVKENKDGYVFRADLPA
jgi:HSP20 family protein